MKQTFLCCFLFICGSYVSANELKVAKNNNQMSAEVYNAASSGMQQNKTESISGVVLDENGESIIGASIIVAGQSIGTVTDIDGNFTLDVPKGSSIQVSFIGYITKTIKNPSASKSIKVVLAEDNQLLDEVIVVGFGTQKKENLTGSVGVTTAKELEARPISNLTQGLQGLVPGLNISQSSGGLDSRASFNIRGSGTISSGSSGAPLVLIDGVEGDINALNPQDVESISVLKDAASSSIYGSRAPFGVVLITTKQGEKGATKVNYNNNFRINTPVSMPEMMDSYTFANYFNDAGINNGQAPHFSDEWLGRILAFQKGEITDQTAPLSSNPNIWDEGYSGGGVNNINYYDVFYKDHSFSQEHNLSFSGGKDRLNYYTSMNILDQSGLMKVSEDKLDRYSATVKLGYDVFDWLKFNYSNRYNKEKFDRPSWLKHDLYRDIARQGWPILPMVDPNGFLMNSWVLRMKDGGRHTSTNETLNQQAQFVFEPVKNWITNAEVYYNTYSAQTHWDTNFTYNHDVNGNAYLAIRDSGAHEDEYKTTSMSLNLYSNYSFTLADAHNFKALVGVQHYNTKQKLFGLSRAGLLSPDHPEVDLTTGHDADGNTVSPSVNGSSNRYVTLGYFGRINYDYKGKYLVEANVRYDGSSRFRKGNRWVWAPSVSLGWNVSHEAFWEPISHIIGTFKLRGSYGQLANQNTSSWYPTYTDIGLGMASGGWLMGGVKPNIAWAPGTLGNPDLTWEKVRSFNIGVDFGLFNNRLTGSFDYYQRKTIDMLGPAPERPAILGVGVPQANNTDLQDYGFEFQIGWQDMLSNGLSYGVKFMLSDYQTKILKYPNLTGNIGQYYRGRLLGEIWGYTTVGIAKSEEEMQNHLASLPDGGQNAFGSNWGAGDIMYKDLNGDGKINGGDGTLSNSGDSRIIGNSMPRYRFGLDLNAAWKGFDVRVFFQGVMKRDFWQGSSLFWGASGEGIWHSAGLKQHEDYFRANPDHHLGVNLDSYYPRPIFSGKNHAVQTKYL